MVECWTVNRGTVVQYHLLSVSKLRQFLSTHICMCLPEETLKLVKASDSFYLVSMPGKVKDPIPINVYPIVDSIIILEIDNSEPVAINGRIKCNFYLQSGYPSGCQNPILAG